MKNRLLSIIILLLALIASSVYANSNVEYKLCISNITRHEYKAQSNYRTLELPNKKIFTSGECITKSSKDDALIITLLKEKVTIRKTGRPSPLGGSLPELFYTWTATLTEIYNKDGLDSLNKEIKEALKKVVTTSIKENAASEALKALSREDIKDMIRQIVREELDKQQQ